MLHIKRHRYQGVSRHENQLYQLELKSYVWACLAYCRLANSFQLTLGIPGFSIAILSTFSPQPVECYAIMQIRQYAKNVCGETVLAVCSATIH